ncbi:ribonuclease E inhibitor RraA/Dimethylmenaquinone methyltransferase [Emericellopsis atlantica]|uniref:Ribonuclease E inhibitor RraA/Dimethylmenaquinone methyltransferase n=1 Tax=Emericellopsis atlantica TaxID=2614577 RepID=A0A9P7ZCZ3_9HYPO|nr:ribonuclease E inhibitor RraA/Dimethylmenaquinone methyltransferase [Emericellopsis atlantica]KAG9249814.1 ribonuclease E inhibitor RraA/Dimethylmenaquinone methyltransferase [Emericellopsis atlantica]
MSAAKSLKLLNRFTSCDIGDALVKLKVPNGGFLDGIRLFSPANNGRIIGPAVTVKMVESSDSSAPRLDKHFVDHNQEGVIMYIQQPKGLPSACWGGLMSTRAQFLGTKGVVIDGRMRDVNEHRGMKFPVFARGISILGSNTFTRASTVNEPLQFKDDLWVNPGDLLVCDDDGCVAVPLSLVDKVAELCEARAEVDEITFDKLRKGEEMGELIQTIRKDK